MIGEAWFDKVRPTVECFVWVAPCRDGTGATDDEVYIRLTLGEVVKHLRLAGARESTWQRIGRKIADAIQPETKP